MKSISKSFDDLCHKDNSCQAYNLFFICSSIFLVVCSIMSIVKFITHHCCQKYEYKYDCSYGNNKYDRYDKYDKYDCEQNSCSCGCNDNACDCE